VSARFLSLFSGWIRLAAFLLATAASSALAQGPTGPGVGSSHQPGFVSGTGTGAGAPVDRVRDHVFANHGSYGLETSDLDDWIVTDVTTSSHNGVTHVDLRQRLAGIEVDGGNLHANVLPDGRIFGLSNRFVPNLHIVANVRAPVLSAEAAIRAAADALGSTVSEPLTRLSNAGGPARNTLFSDGGISLDEIPLELVYHTEGDGSARLAWNLFLRPPDSQHWWNLNIDAVTGTLLRKTDWILNDSYRVLPLPFEDPDDGARTLEADPAEPTASPYGWHDTDAVAGAEFTDTRGNNVNAQEDADANNTGGFRPDGGGGLDFDFPLDLHEAPAVSQSAAISNLFYWNNILHDVHYQYGFDEASGNYQVNNYGKGGTGGDPVNADAIDGLATNNANFSRAPEGTSPRMQMFRFEHTGVTIHAPTSLRQMLAGGTADFGPVLDATGITGDVVLGLDPPDAPLFSTTDGCSAFTNGAQVSGKIAVIDRGECVFEQKVANAQAAGAIAAIVVNTEGDEVLRMGGSDPAVTIPSMLIGKSHGDAIKAALGSGVNLTLSSLIQRDGDFDSGIIIHEYGHGVSIRLSGGPSNAGCLGLAQSAGMGEGWGDFWALALTAIASDQGTDARGLGTYAEGQGPNGPGIRNFPYSTDLLVNPQTFLSIDGTNQPHGVGEIWAQALWEMYWNLVAAHGFDTDLYGGAGGNNIALQLVMDALKTQGCDPTFLAARDAVLMADTVNNAGANQCLIWNAFAKRGMGEFADDTGNPRRLKVTEDFTVPSTCLPVCGNGVFESGEQCDDGNTLAGDCCSATCQFESAATECRPATGTCDVADFCTGASGPRRRQGHRRMPPDSRQLRRCRILRRRGRCLPCGCGGCRPVRARGHLHHRRLRREGLPVPARGGRCRLLRCGCLQRRRDLSVRRVRRRNATGLRGR